jgi:membrane protease YdiL (CAAX protease family)
MGPWINNEIQKITVSLGRDPSAGPKLDMTIFLAGPILLIALATIIFFLPIHEFHRTLTKDPDVRNALLWLSMLGPFCFILQQEYRACLDQIGLRGKILLSKSTLVWTIIAIAFTGAEIFISWVFVNLMVSITPGHPALVLHLVPPSGIENFVDFLLRVLVGPPLEELLFRGYLYLVLRQNWGRRWGAIISSAVFGAAHLSNILVAFDCFFVSLVYVYVDNRARSLAPSIAAHASYNTVLCLLQSR